MRSESAFRLFELKYDLRNQLFFLLTSFLPSPFGPQEHRVGFISLWLRTPSHRWSGRGPLWASFVCFVSMTISCCPPPKKQNAVATEHVPRRSIPELSPCLPHLKEPGSRLNLIFTFPLPPSPAGDVDFSSLRCGSPWDGADGLSPPLISKALSLRTWHTLHFL